MSTVDTKKKKYFFLSSRLTKRGNEATVLERHKPILKNSCLLWRKRKRVGEGGMRGLVCS